MKFDYYSEPMVRAYIAAGMWLCDDGDENSGHDAIDQVCDEDGVAYETWVTAKEDCDKFLELNKDDLENEDLSQVGHDFWLTRNNHGAGFWDGDYEEEKGKRLTESCNTFGECWLCIGADSKVHFI